jgi:fluoroquinolone resistance protein
MADRIYGAPPPPTDSEISNADWEGEDLSGQEHTRVAFSHVDLTDAADRGAVFTKCAFRDCRFNGSSHVDAAFVNCTFTRCSFFDTTFTNCKLVGSMFDRCTYELLRCEGGDWSFVGLPGADLRRASLKDLRMREADLTHARCDGGRLCDVDLSGASLHGASFVGTDLRGSDLSALNPLAAQLGGAIVDPDQAITIAEALGLDVRPAADDERR